MVHCRRWEILGGVTAIGLHPNPSRRGLRLGRASGALAKGLDHVADREAVQGRLNVDRDQATPPAAAIASAHSKAPKAQAAHPSGRLETGAEGSQPLDPTRLRTYTGEALERESYLTVSALVW